MKTQSISVFIFCLFFTVCIGTAQEHETHQEHESELKKHSLAFAMSHTHTDSGVKNGKKDSWITMPSFGINYNYNFNHQWAIGLHNDIILEEFVVNKSSSAGHELHSTDPVEGEIERGRPISSAIMVTYKAFKHLSFLAGGGMEFSEHENFGVVRLAVEAPFELPGHWEIFGAFAFDINIDAYNSYTLGLGIAKGF